MNRTMRKMAIWNTSHQRRRTARFGAQEEKAATTTASTLEALLFSFGERVCLCWLDFFIERVIVPKASIIYLADVLVGSARPSC